MSSLCRRVALHDLYWNFLFFHQMICKQYIFLNLVFLNPLHTPPFWLTIFHDVSKLKIIQHTHNTQLYFADNFLVWPMLWEPVKKVGTNTPIPPTEPMLKLSLFFLPFQSESTIPDQMQFVLFWFFFKSKIVILKSLNCITKCYKLEWILQLFYHRNHIDWYL